MRFSSEATRLEHPQARLFPSSLWDLVAHKGSSNGVDYYTQIDDEALSMMTIDLAAMDKDKISARASDKNHQLNCWLCLLLAHSDASTTDLLQAAQRLSLPPSIILKGALLTHRLDIADGIEKNPLEIQSVIAEDDYRVFRLAAANGYLDVLNWLKTETPSQLQAMIATDNYIAFRLAAENGCLVVLNWLKAEAPSRLQAMVAEYNYNAFTHAAANGHLDVLNWFRTEAPSQMQDMITASHYYPFCQAAANGHIDILHWLKTEAPSKLQAMISTKKHEAFRRAAGNGHLAVLKWLKTEAPSQWQAMIAADNYISFSKAADNGHLDVLNWLKTEAPSQLQAMIAANDYLAFRQAAENNRLDVLKWLKTEAPSVWRAMIAANNYYAFHYAATNGHLAVTQYLLSFPTCFAYAEKHEAEYSRLTHPFIADKLASLHSQRSTLQTDNPQGVFDISDADDAQGCFYIIRNLIRRNDPTLLDDIRFLLEIPAVKALTHQAVSPGVLNELVRLALTTGNREAAEILLAIPAVHALARTNNFYATEARGGFDLRELAQDRESSMKSLTTDEQRRLDAAIKKYQLLLTAAGAGELMTALREQLEERYAEHPATITVNGTNVVLTVDWPAFQRLELDATQRQDALKAYYQNKNHTALRYLARPNHWMAPNASYVYINDAHTERWSTFEEYQPLITLFWLAAMDKTTPAIDGYTVETRLDHFIEELACIGRAHNWDTSRPIAGIAGQTEEYDDLAGDKPSCYSGVKRRLFQSVLGHPLFKILSQEMIDDELRNFVRGEFSSAITDANRGQLKACFDTYVETLEISAAEIAAFSALNIPAAKQQTFIVSLSEKYGPQFDARMQSNIRKELSLNPASDNPGDVLHAFKFDEFAAIAQLLAPFIPTVSPSIYPPRFLAGAISPAAAAPTESSATPIIRPAIQQ